MSFVTAAIIAGAATVAASGISAYSASRANKAAGKQASAAASEAQLAQDLAEQSDPLRRQLLGQYENYLTHGILPSAFNVAGEEPETYGLDEFLAGGALPEALGFERNTAYNRDVLEAQFNRARENTLGQAPALGGRLADALTDLEGQRALGITGLETQESLREQSLRHGLFGTGLDFAQAAASRKARLREQLFGQAAGAGFNSIGPALSGLGGAASQYGNIAGNALRGTELFADLAGTALGAGAPFLQRALAPQPFYPPGLQAQFTAPAIQSGGTFPIG